MYEGYYSNSPQPMQQAQEIALKRVPGTIQHVDMDLENGVLVYEVIILTPDN
ncbi:PepSY domain-containing protein [Oceanobacillus luteolus]|uniref:PepSY domain-containing protein n=1 Tax=Oceanobacillus luteolus TaxID=1274358 RepID=UPI00203FB874|nr:PepSY domain-containing protein [Oceanobacillus luteolus]MCM3741242.1 PepSY domain-containing protein [Oceanobacillus luteolus]